MAIMSVILSGTSHLWEGMLAEEENMSENAAQWRSQQFEKLRSKWGFKLSWELFHSPFSY